MTKLKALHTALFCTLAIGVLLTAAYQNANAATPGERTPKAKYAAVNVKIDDAGTNIGTLVFASPMIGRNALAIANEGATKIWCGWDKAVTYTTGFPVAAGSSLSVDIVYNGSNDPALYCVVAPTGVNQTSPNNTRVMEVR